MKIIIKTIICTTLVLFSSAVFSAETQNEATNEETKKNGTDDWVPPKLKTYSKADIRKECKKFDGKYISYYSKVYFVKNCERHEIKSQQRVEKLSLHHKVVSVEGSTIIMIKKVSLTKIARKPEVARDLTIDTS